MRKKITIILATVAVIVLVIAFLPRRYEATFYPMGGIPFKVVAYGKNYVEFDRIMEAVENRVSELERIFSKYNKTSELSKLNGTAGKEPFKISEKMGIMIGLSERWYLQSAGAFDPSVAPLVDLWRRAGKADVLPSEEEIASLLKSVGMNRVDRVDGNKIFFAAKGMELDFGAIAKGFIVDEVVPVAKEAGNEFGLIEAGGDAYVFVEDETKIGVQDPTDISKLMATVKLSKGAIVTSGDYERYVEIDGKKYSHIIDPRTGYPADYGVISVTVVGKTAVGADALATSVMVLGVEQGIALVRRVGDMEVIIVERAKGDLIVHVSEGLLSRIEWNGDWSDRVKTF